ncbi:MAG: VirB3 family type IV secretion system protein [Gammaproteobacteria bacterium]|nr:VirB3 family type IV secretion system protein [Gammaproteobacteria bacterium]
MIKPINKALMRPLLIGGVEKRLCLFNGLLSFPLIAATHFHFPSCLLGVGLFGVLHIMLRWVSKSDPYIGILIQRSTRYSIRSYFPARSHPLQLNFWPIRSVVQI